MSQLITYSQNREDLFLFALIGHVEKGFFVDVGAYHPTLHSVTKLFSDMGWSGINVEANPRLFALFEAERTGDLNVCAAISDVSGTISFRDYPFHDGLSTVSTGMKGIHEESLLPFTDLDVPAVTLRDLFNANNVTGIDFLKVDVEGHEVEVLESNDWTRWRPTVVTFEANRGQEAIDCVAQHGYHLEFFDGLNHYMVANEAREVSILNFAGRILHPGFVTRREQELLDSYQEPKSEMVTRAASSELVGALGIKGSALKLGDAVKKRVGSPNQNQRVGRVLRKAASQASKATRVGKKALERLDTTLGRKHVVNRPSLILGGNGRYSDRVQTALISRESAVNDFFGGWQPDDLELFEAWRIDVSQEVAPKGEILDWLGCRTAAAHHSWLTVPENSGVVVSDVPVPDDQVHAEAIEYFGLLTSLKEAQKGSFCVVELGASYAPWSVAACVIANRSGFRNVHGIAVEANAGTLSSIDEHVARNQVVENGASFKVLHGAVSVSSEPVFFPTVDTAVDNGAQAIKNPSDSDYRGVRQEYCEVPGLTLSVLTDGIARVDFLHMDLQGAEEELLRNDEFLSVLTAKVGVLMLATQSRFIEGLALRELSRRGWSLLRERPTTFKPNQRTMDVNGWTLRDGAQVWRNPTIVDTSR